jgi:predicted acylesterase/phospholipase RssA
MLLGMKMLGLREAFDVVYGASAGAINAAFFIADQHATAVNVYYNPNWPNPNIKNIPQHRARTSRTVMRAQ